MTAKPFVKWAGGKSQLLMNIRKKYPREIGKSITKYCEPFVGGGAVLFDILSKYPLKEVLINDINMELINTYMQVKVNVDFLIAELSAIQNYFLPLDTEQRKKYYYDKRERFNYLKVNGNESVNLEKATLFIFLNRTCFNGLFRVNKQGLFNVPMGAYKNPMICDATNLENISQLLKKVTIKCGDYKECLSFASDDTFVYIDPPYRPLSETASFTSYTEMVFDDKEQLELVKFVDRLSEKGAKVIISNSDPKNSNENDNFFDELYSKYNIARVAARRMINCNSENRGNISELLISNYVCGVKNEVYR